MDVAKVLRTAQSRFPALKPLKDAAYRHVRRVLQRPHEPDFRVLAGLRREPGEILVDVGANQGQSIESMRLFQPQAEIVAFEANPSLAAMLARRYARQPQIRIEGCGVGDVPGIFQLYVPSYRGFVYDGLASTDRREAESWLGPATLYGFDPGKLTIAGVDCRIATLDSLDLVPAFVKVDVQGTEFAVLRGARKTLERHRPAILVEDMEQDPRIGPFVAGLGYDVFHAEAGTVVPGPGPGPNTLLLPRDRPRFAPAQTGKPHRG